MTFRGTIPFSLILNTTDRTFFASHAYGRQSQYDEPDLNKEYTELLKDIAFSVSNESCSLALKELEFALHDNAVVVHTDCEFPGYYNNNSMALIMEYLGEVKALVNQCFNENNVDFPESVITYLRGTGFFIPFEMNEDERQIEWYRVQVTGLCFPDNLLEQNGLTRECQKDLSANTPNISLLQFTAGKSREFLRTMLGRIVH